jgi:hypothetical protein
MKTHKREDIERFIVHENRILEECVDLINRRVPLSEWPRETRIAFLLALQPREDGEISKAFTMARHLRIGGRFEEYDVPETPSALHRRCSERIRADLPGLVRLGAGRHLRI